MKAPLGSAAMFLVIIFLTGCTVDLTPEEQRVRVTLDAALVKDCEYKGSVKGRDNRGGPLEFSRRQAINRMIRNAHRLGADTVYQTNVYLAYNEFYAVGEAFDCSARVSATDRISN